MFKCIAMVPLVSFLAALRILTEAQSCNNGIGKLVYEKITDFKLNGVAKFNNNINNNKAIKEVITRNDLPIKVLEECVRRCQEDRLTAIQNCLSFDFSPGKRRSSPFRNPQIGKENIPNISAEYEPSTCTLYNDRGNPDGEDTLVREENAWHYNEVCLSSTKVSTQCANRLYIFERIPGYKFEGIDDKEIQTKNRTECEDQCLNEHTFVCRSASFNRKTNKCKLSKETRYTNPKAFKVDPNCDYVENMCLPRTQMCSWNAFILETAKQLDPIYERVLMTANDFNDCSNSCLESLEKHGFLCRSFMFDESGQTCILYDEDPLSYEELSPSDSVQNTQQFKSRPLKPSPGNLYRVLCVSDEKDDSLRNATLECYRSKRLKGKHQVELGVYSFFDCLQECMRRFRRNCRSVEYSSLKRFCRFSSFDGIGKNNSNLIDDKNFDFYKFMWYRSGEGVYPQSYVSHTYDQRSGYVGGHQPIPGMPPSSESFYNGFQTGIWQSPNTYQARDHHRGGFSYDEYGPGGYTASRRSGFNGNYGTASRYPGYGVPPYGSYSQHSSTHTSYPINTSGGGGQQQAIQPPLSPPTYGIPYSVPSSGSYNAIAAPFPPQPPKGTELCKFSTPTGSAAPPVSARFSRIGFSSRLRSQYVFKVVRADKIEDCERACTETRDFVCKSFNFRAFFPDNCELSHFDSKEFKYDNPAYFEHNSQYDYYERSDLGTGPGPVSPNSDCMEVTQTCTPEGMEFSLRTSEPFYGRIYTYGFYDSCFFDGNGGTTSVLRISRANGFPRCGTQQYGDAMTNIVVVQFNDYVQTSRDKKYNLTCFFSGPGEAVVTSNYLDTKTDGRHPTQIEHLPAQNILTSNVVLRVLYRGTPTNTIVVGDLLTFRLEARGQYRYDLYNNDIFAANVIAKDPYTGRQVHLVDARGCPVDLYVFPELHKTPDGGLEAEFYAFKIPDSNFLVFQATVRTCRGPCEPVICNDRGRGPGSFPSWGRKKRSASRGSNSTRSNSTEEAEEVHELLRVYLSREDIPVIESKAQTGQSSLGKILPKICVPQTGYYALVASVTILTSIVTVSAAMAAIIYFRRTKVLRKDIDFSVPNAMNGNFYVNQYKQTAQPFSSHQKFDDPSEPIYTDPSLFERSRSLRSLTISNLGNVRSQESSSD